MACRQIDSEILRGSRSLEDTHTQLGVLKSITGDTLSPPIYITPENVAPESLPYMSGTDRREFNLDSLYANNRAALDCLLNGLGYNATRAEEIHREVTSRGANEAAISQYLQTLSAQEARTYSVFTTLQTIEYFRTRGNTDGRQNIVTDRELSQYAWEASGHNREGQAAMGGRVVARFHALLGLAHFLGTEPPAPPSPPQTTQRPAATFAQGEPVLFNAPADGWLDGDTISVNGTDITYTIIDPLIREFPIIPVEIPPYSLQDGVNEIVLQRVDGSFETQQVTIRPTAATIPAPEETSSRSFMDSVGDFFSEPTVAFGAGALAAGLAAFIFLRRAFKGRSEAETKLAEETRVRTEAEAALTRARTELARVQGEFGSLGSTITAARPRIEADLPRLRDELQVKEGELGTAEGSLGRSVADANLPQEIGRVEADVSAKAGEVSRLQAQLKSRSLPRGVTKTGIRQELTRLTGEEKGNGTTGELGQARAELETLRDIARLRVEVAQWKVDIALREAGLNATDAFAALDSALNPPPPAPPPQPGGTPGTP